MGDSKRKAEETNQELLELVKKYKLMAEEEKTQREAAERKAEEEKTQREAAERKAEEEKTQRETAEKRSEEEKKALQVQLAKSYFFRFLGSLGTADAVKLYTEQNVPFLQELLPTALTSIDRSKVQKLADFLREKHKTQDQNLNELGLQKHYFKWIEEFAKEAGNLHTWGISMHYSNKAGRIPDFALFLSTTVDVFDAKVYQEDKRYLLVDWKLTNPQSTKNTPPTRSVIDFLRSIAQHLTQHGTNSWMFPDMYACAFSRNDCFFFHVKIPENISFETKLHLRWTKCFLSECDQVVEGMFRIHQWLQTTKSRITAGAEAKDTRNIDDDSYCPLNILHATSQKFVECWVDCKTQQLVCYTSFSEFDQAAIEQAEHETKILSSLQTLCPKVPRLLHHGKYSGSPFFIVDTVGVPLGAVHHPLSSSVKSKIFKQLLEAVQALHSQGVLHLDIHPGNILLIGEDLLPLIPQRYILGHERELERVVLIDYGSAQFIHEAHWSFQTVLPFCSVATMAGEVPTVLDDLESCVYIWMWMERNGELPWATMSNTFDVATEKIQALQQFPSGSSFPLLETLCVKNILFNALKCKSTVKENLQLFLSNLCY